LRGELVEFCLKDRKRSPFAEHRQDPQVARTVPFGSFEEHVSVIARPVKRVLMQSPLLQLDD
jgi:hypothetical protein